jgi:hypothetical protein
MPGVLSEAGDWYCATHRPGLAVVVGVVDRLASGCEPLQPTAEITVIESKKETAARGTNFIPNPRGLTFKIESEILKDRLSG